MKNYAEGIRKGLGKVLMNVIPSHSYGEEEHRLLHREPRFLTEIAELTKQIGDAVVGIGVSTPIALVAMPFLPGLVGKGEMGGAFHSWDSSNHDSDLLPPNILEITRQQMVDTQFWASGTGPSLLINDQLEEGGNLSITMANSALDHPMTGEYVMADLLAGTDNVEALVNDTGDVVGTLISVPSITKDQLLALVTERGERRTGRPNLAVDRLFADGRTESAVAVRLLDGTSVDGQPEVNMTIVGFNAAGEQVTVLSLELDAVPLITGAENASLLAMLVPVMEGGKKKFVSLPAIDDTLSQGLTLTEGELVAWKDDNGNWFAGSNNRDKMMLLDGDEWKLVDETIDGTIDVGGYVSAELGDVVDGKTMIKQFFASDELDPDQQVDKIDELDYTNWGFEAGSLVWMQNSEGKIELVRADDHSRVVGWWERSKVTARTQFVANSPEFVNPESSDSSMLSFARVWDGKTVEGSDLDEMLLSLNNIYVNDVKKYALERQLSLRTSNVVIRSQDGKSAVVGLFVTFSSDTTPGSGALFFESNEKDVNDKYIVEKIIVKNFE